MSVIALHQKQIEKRVTFFYHIYKRFFIFRIKSRVLTFLNFFLTFITSMVIRVICVAGGIGDEKLQLGREE